MENRCLFKCKTATRRKKIVCYLNAIKQLYEKSGTSNFTDYLAGKVIRHCSTISVLKMKTLRSPYVQFEEIASQNGSFVCGEHNINLLNFTKLCRNIPIKNANVPKAADYYRCKMSLFWE